MKRYFDITTAKFDSGFYKRLGFYYFFTLGEDVLISDNPQQANKLVILSSRNDGKILRHLNTENVIGAIIEGNSRQRLLMEALSKSGKPAFIAANGILNAEPRARIRRLHEARKFVRDSARYKTGIAMVSMAQSREELLSSMQMFELAKLIGLPEEKARSSNEILGRYHDKQG